MSYIKKMIVREIVPISYRGALRTGGHLFGTHVFKFLGIIRDEFTLDDYENQEVIKRNVEDPEGRTFELMRIGGKRGFWRSHWRGKI